MKTLSDEFENEVMKINNLLHSIKLLNDNSQDNLWEVDKLRTKEKLSNQEQKNLDDCMRQNFRNSFAINELLEVLTDIDILENYPLFSNAIFKSETLKVS